MNFEEYPYSTSHLANGCLCACVANGYLGYRSLHKYILDILFCHFLHTVLGSIPDQSRPVIIDVKTTGVIIMAAALTRQRPYYTRVPESIV